MTEDDLVINEIFLLHLEDGPSAQELLQIFKERQETLKYFIIQQSGGDLLIIPFNPTTVELIACEK